jgi:hypothetical protein
MHLSHIFEDLEAWYLNLDFRDRVNTTFRPRLPVRPGTQTVPQPPHRVASENEVRRDYDRFGVIGHSSSLQPASRLQQNIRSSDGTLYPKGTAIPQRADFSTLDNPFFWAWTAARPMGEGRPRASHFVVFNPTSDDFIATGSRWLACGGGKLSSSPRPAGFNSIPKTTHRQNFLVPPRRHRSFPLVELA